MRFVAALLLSINACAADAHWSASRIHGSPEPPKPFVAEPVFSWVALNNALDMVPAPGLGQWLFVENGGKIWAVPDDTTTAQADLAIDLKAAHPDVDHAYGVAFHPRFKENKEVFITYTNGDKKDDGTRLSRFKVTREKPLQIDPASEEILLTWLSGGHNGAAIAFGPDGFLYVSAGDGEVPAPPDPRLTGQDISDLLSSVMRIDVDRKDEGKAYAVPRDNPFVSTPKARPELWCYGLRNPWKISFDRATGNLWCGDVGWEQWEQIYLIKRGGNYGWSAMEGNNPIAPERKGGPSPITPPVVTHHHSEAASITGGFVYHGQRLPELEGAYVYGDYETGKIWALWHDGKQITRHEEIADTPLKIVTFGQGEDGELYFVHYGNPASVHRLTRNPDTGKASAFPRKLSETGLFTDVVKQTPNAGVHAFEIRAPMWADGAQGTRFIGMPSGSVSTEVRIDRKDGKLRGKVTWPAETVLAKTLSMQLDASKPESAVKIETQVLHYDGVAWNGYSYRWNDAGTDAELVAASGDERTLQLAGDAFPGGKHRYTYRFHSRGECLRCHNNWSGFALSFQPQQLTEDKRWIELGLVDANYFKQSEARLVNPRDDKAQLEHRARSWLHANCAHCHRENGGGSVALMLNAELANADMKALDEKPLRGTFGIIDTRIIATGDVWHSALLHRVSTQGAGHMPAIGSQEIDARSAGMLAEWIASLSPQKQIVLHSEDPLHRPDSALCIALWQGKISSERAPAASQLNATPGIDPHIRGLLERFLPDDQRPQVLGASASAAKILAVKGDAARGAELMKPVSKGAVCLSCHFVNGTGRDFGPDLTKVGARLPKEQIVESMLTPSKVIAQGFAPVVVTMKNGSAQTGFVVKRDADAVQLKIATGQTLPLKLSDIQSEQTLPASLMPEGLLAAFTAQEAADLVEYLAGLGHP